MTYINKMGDNRSPILSSLAFELWTWCLQRRTSITARHIPGIQNIQADQELRTVVDHSDWKLKPEIFQCIQSLGPSRNGSLCIPPVVPDPKVRKLETRPTGGNSGCLYPRLGSAGGVCLSPLCIGREMSKTSHSPESPKIGFSSPAIGNPTLVPITPPTLCRFPSVTSTTSRSVDQAGGNHPLTHLKLAGWLISTGHIQRQVFLQKLEHCSWLHGGKTPQVPIVQLGKSGLAGVINNRLIPFQPLYQQC